MQIDGRQFPSLGGIPLMHKLGQGGMGAVYYGIHLGFGHEVAVKVLPFHLAQKDPDSIKRFFREARIATKIKSAHLVHVTDVAQENGISYLVMEYISGFSAGQILKQVRMGGEVGLPEKTALEICISACRGLADAHSVNVIHRDIKPDNILVPRRDKTTALDYACAKLADLGLARNEELSQSMTVSNASLGTPGFMAPEQIENAHDASKPADVFSMGATLYALLSGGSPFDGDSIIQVMRETMDTPHMPIRGRRADISKPTSTLIDLCLAKDPEHRYADASSLLKGLLACRTALTDPQGASYLDINGPLLKRQVETNPLPLIALKPAVVRPRLFKKAVMCAAVVFLVLMAYALWPVSERKPNTSNASLPTVKELDESEGLNDQKAAAKDAIDKNRVIATDQKLLEMTKQKELEAQQQIDLAEGARAQCIKLFAQAKTASQQGDWERAQTLLNQAMSCSSATATLSPEETRALDTSIKLELRKLLVEKEYKDVLESIQNTVAKESLDEYGHYAFLNMKARTHLETSLIRLRNIREDSAAVKSLREKLSRDLTLTLSGNYKLEMVLASPGEFTMGYSGWEKGTGADYEHVVQIVEPYYIAKYPVTVDQFRHFIELERYVTDAEKGDSTLGKGTLSLKNRQSSWREEINWRNPGFTQHDDHPVVAVSWHDCQKFCEWLSHSKGRVFRLPTEAEWEYAARGPQGYQWPWGNTWDGLKCNHADVSLKAAQIIATNPAKPEIFSSENDSYVYTSPVGHFDNASWCGSVDMAGNVSQWCSDWYAENYYLSSPSVSPPGPAQADQVLLEGMRSTTSCKVARGGSFLNGSDMQRSSARRKVPSTWRSIDLGFRIVLSPVAKQ